MVVVKRSQDTRMGLYSASRNPVRVRTAVRCHLQFSPGEPSPTIRRSRSRYLLEWGLPAGPAGRYRTAVFNAAENMYIDVTAGFAGGTLGPVSVQGSVKVRWGC